MIKKSGKSYIYRMENSPELKALIRKNAHLFWYIKDSEKENLPLPVVLEFFINYAQKEDIKDLFRIVGIKNAAKVFFEQIDKSERSANNYNTLSRHYFSLYFSKYASWDIKHRTNGITPLFKEIFETSDKCKYNNCSHRHEPGCAVREAVEQHLISESRYTSYLNILQDKEEGKYRAAY